MARARPSPPEPAGNNIGSVAVLKPCLSSARILASSSLSRIGVLSLSSRRAFGAGREQVALRGRKRRLDLRHQFLADSVERRIGHLSEQLLEVVVQQPRALRQHRQRARRCPWNRWVLHPSGPSAPSADANPRACNRTPAGARAPSHGPAPARAEPRAGCSAEPGFRPATFGKGCAAV